MKRKDWIFTAILFIVAIISRLIPHYPNFTAIGSIAVVGGITFKNWSPALLSTVGSLFISDLIINNTLYAEYYGTFTWISPGAGLIYGSFVFSVFIPRMIRLQNLFIKWVIASISSTVVFFLVTNLGVWYQSAIYPQNLVGLMACYGAAIPFALNQLLGTFFYGALLLLGFSYVRKHVVEVA